MRVYPPRHLTRPVLDRPGELLLRAVDNVGLLVVHQSHVAQVKTHQGLDLFKVLVLQVYLVEKDAFTKMINPDVFSLD